MSVGFLRYTNTNTNTIRDPASHPAPLGTRTCLTASRTPSGLGPQRMHSMQPSLMICVVLLATVTRMVLAQQPEYSSMYGAVPKDKASPLRRSGWSVSTYQAWTLRMAVCDTKNSTS